MSRTFFFWDPLSDNILQERDESGTVTAEYTTEPGLYGNLISQSRGGVESQYHFDPQGSTLALSDDNQQVTDTYAYTAFGELTEHAGSTVNPFQYIGQKQYYRDPETGEYGIRRRDLLPLYGRWGSVDTLSSDGWHAYLYVHNRPCSLLDPSGLLAIVVKELEKYISPKCQKGAFTSKYKDDMGKPFGYKEPVAAATYQFALDKPAPCTGNFFAKITIKCNNAKCSGCTCPDKIPGQEFTYVEAFGRVEKGAMIGVDTKNSGYTDVASYGTPLLTCGDFFQEAEIRFYCKLRDADAGALPGYDVYTGDEIKTDVNNKNMDGWGQARKHGEGGCEFPIGNATLPTKKDPKWWKEPNNSVTGPAKRSLTAKWNCCPGNDTFEAKFTP